MKLEDLESIIVLMGLIFLFFFVLWTFTPNGQLTIAEFLGFPIPDEKWLP